MTIDYATLFQSVQTQVQNAVTAVLPIAVGVLAVILAIRVGARIVKALSR